MTSVANYGDRGREASCKSKQPAPLPEPELELPPAGTVTARFFEGARERAWQSRQAQALQWSAGQAELMAAAGSVQLLFDRDGVLRHYPRPGWAGQAVVDGRITPLVKAGLLTITEPYGPGSQRVDTTVDGRDALLLWRRWRPVPVVKDHQGDRAPLQPLLGGEEAARRADAAAEDQRRREAERETLYAALEETHAWEARTEPLRGRELSPLPAALPESEQIAGHSRYQAWRSGGSHAGGAGAELRDGRLLVAAPTSHRYGEVGAEIVHMEFAYEDVGPILADLRRLTAS